MLNPYPQLKFNMRLETAKTIANDIVRKLEPYCVRIFIAGSIRREKLEVGDIEIICTPKKVQKGGNTLFESVTVEYSVDPNFIKEVNALGEKTKGSPEGRYCRVFISHMYGKINCDIFIPQEHDFFRQLAIRTGSRDYAHKVIAVAWRKHGWVGTEDGLRRHSECEDVNEGKLDGNGVRMKPKFICVAEKPMTPPVWRSEEQFFDWIGLTWVHPKERNL